MDRDKDENLKAAPEESESEFVELSFSLSFATNENVANNVN